jgi:hypothetical protein
VRMLLALIGVGALTWLGAWGLLRADAARLANGLRIAGPVLMVAFGVVLLILGRAQLAGLLISGGLYWIFAARRRIAATPSKGTRSTVRSAALEMELDHDSGALEGLVLAGRYEGRVLGEMTEAELLDLRRDLVPDAESLQLLETYLDSRLAAWREHVEPDGGGRQTGAPASGAMTEKEAYQILGLEPGAGTADIRKAHRRLMQRLHPDLGGSSFLAARINEAKDLLLSLHG